MIILEEPEGIKELSNSGEGMKVSFVFKFLICISEFASRKVELLSSDIFNINVYSFVWIVCLLICSSLILFRFGALVI